MISIIRKSIPFCALILLFNACSESNDSTLTVPTEYISSQFESNASTELALLNQLSALVTEMKRGKSNEVTLQETVLNQLFEDGEPSLEDISTVYYGSKISATWFNELANSSGSTYVPGETSEHGGVFSGYLFDETGLEYEQVIDKGLYTASLYNRFLTLSKQEITSSRVDQMLAIFGANPSFASSNNSSLHDSPDKVVAVYTARRDKNDGTGFYSSIKNEFLRLKAASEFGDTFKTDKMEAVNEIKANWEKAVFATVINYSYSTLDKLSQTNPSDADKASALHSYSECVGFVHGFKSIPQSDKIITDEQIDEILSLLNAPSNGTSTSYLFVTDAVNQLSKIETVISKIQAIYGFSASDLENFKKNWVSEQGR